MQLAKLNNLCASVQKTKNATSLNSYAGKRAIRTQILRSVQQTIIAAKLRRHANLRKSATRTMIAKKTKYATLQHNHTCAKKAITIMMVTIMLVIILVFLLQWG